MFNNGIVVSSVEDLQSMIDLAVEKAIEKRKAVPDLPAQGEVGLIDRAELIKRLRVTEQTVIRYEKKGKIPSHRIGDAARYDWNEVKKATLFKA